MEKLYGIKQEKDRYVITYVFASTEKVENQKISANAEISLYDQEKN